MDMYMEGKVSGREGGRTDLCFFYVYFLIYFYFLWLFLIVVGAYGHGGLTHEAGEG